jgi:hypothetical protein
VVKLVIFLSKCPYAKNIDSDEEESPKKEKKYQKGDKKRNKKKFFKKILYSREDSSSSDEDDDSDSDSERVLFMALENDKEYYEEEGEVDLEAELINALSEIKRERKKNKSLKEELIKLKEGSQNPKNSEEVQQMIMNLKVQVEEARRIEETLKNQLEEKEKMKERLEAEIVSLRKELQKKDMQQNNTKILDEIINIQRPYYDKSGLGYKQMHTEKGSSSMMTEKEEEKKSYAEVIRGPIKKEECKSSKENI